MKCHLYMQLIDGASRRLGPFDICDEAEARRRAELELQNHRDIQAVDIWWDSGELYRIERSGEPGNATGRAVDAWKSAFSGGPRRSTTA